MHALWHFNRKIKMKSVLIIPFKDKIKFRRIIKKDYRLILMVKQHDSWFQIPDKPMYQRQQHANHDNACSRPALQLPQLQGGNEASTALVSA